MWELIREHVNLDTIGKTAMITVTCYLGYILYKLDRDREEDRKGRKDLNKSYARLAELLKEQEEKRATPLSTLN